MRISYYAWLVIMVLLFAACRQESQNTMTEEEFEQTRDALVGANRILVAKDRERIEAFAERKEWHMLESQTGLWYEIYHEGSGQHAERGMDISLEYTLSLLDGTVCYSSDSLGLKQFRIGSGGVESGLEEAVLLLKEGDSARFILPPHLAHGLPGDGNKIPPRAIIVYDVAVVGVNSE